MKKLACGHTVAASYHQDSLDYQGKIIDINTLDNESKKIELGDISEGNPIYYYYEEETLKYIKDGDSPTARIYDMCESCLYETLLTNTPHYGDGVYFSLHSNLYAPETSQVVIDSHGIGVREYKATYMCQDSTPFIKIKKTAGVIRSFKHKVVNDRLCLDDGIVFLMSIS